MLTETCTFKMQTACLSHHEHDTKATFRNLANITACMYNLETGRRLGRWYVKKEPVRFVSRIPNAICAVGKTGFVGPLIPGELHFRVSTCIRDHNDDDDDEGINRGRVYFPHVRPHAALSVKVWESHLTVTDHLYECYHSSTLANKRFMSLLKSKRQHHKWIDNFDLLSSRLKSL